MAEYKKAYVIRKKLIDIYEKHRKKILDPNYSWLEADAIEKLRKYFPVQDGMTEDERNQIVSILLSAKNINVQDLIDLFFFGSKDNKIWNRIRYMQNDYNNLGKIILTPCYDSYNLLSYLYKSFGITEGMSQKEKNVRVDIALQEGIYFIYAKKVFHNQGFKLIDDLDSSKKPLYFEALELIEYVYTQKMGFTKWEYFEYYKKRILEMYYNRKRYFTKVLRDYIDSEIRALSIEERDVYALRVVKK